MACMTRRTFLKSAGAAATVTLLPSGLAKTYAANNKVDLGFIGTGGVARGSRGRFRQMSREVNVVALCDVDRDTLAAAAGDHGGARTYVDFRKMLTAHKGLDAVMVSTPDHTHYPASMLAIKLGKHVSTEKPMAHSVWEARQLALAAARHKVATQMDNEHHASPRLRQMVEWLQAGAIGKVREVHIFSNRPIWPQGMSKRPPSEPPPKNLEWDLWIGAAPYRDYHKGLHRFSWRGWWDFGTGALGDMGCHQFDPAFWALKPASPTTVEAEQEGNTAESGPKWSVITYQFPARGELPPVTLKWWDGGKMPPRPEELEAGRKMPKGGLLFVGETGKILASHPPRARIIPEAKMKAYRQPEPFIPRSPGHRKEWIDAIRGGKPASSNFTDYSGPLTEVVLLGNLAIRTGGKIEWDAKNLKAKGCPEADQYIRREYRKGWEF